VALDEEFEALYKNGFQSIYRAVFALCGDRVAAEDATQEAFARALERWKRLGGKPWVEQWIAKTALNLGRRTFRRPKRAGYPPPRESEPDVEAAFDLHRAIRALPRKQREATIYFYVLDFSVPEVAHAMGCSEGSVKTHLSRAREALRLAHVRDGHD
jgi:RNA polymerase sigma-70 factor (ECF subfamily)